MKSLIAIVFSFCLIMTFQNCSEGFKTLEQGSTSGNSVLSGPTINFLNAPDVVSTSNLSLNFEVTGSGVSLITCSLNGSAAQNCTSKSINYTNLPDGDYVVEVAATNSQGTTGRARKNVQKDTIGPVINVTMMPPASTSVTAAGFVFAVTDNLSGVSSIQCSLDNAAFANCVSPMNLANLSVASHNFRIQARDNAGNNSTVYTHTWTVVLPTIPIVNILTLIPSLTNQTAASLSFNGQGVVSYECQLNNLAFTACVSPQNYSMLPAGTHTFRLRGVTDAGLKTAEVMATWTVDLVAPTAPNIVSNVTGLSKILTASFTFSATDASGIASYQCSLNNAAFANCTSPVNLANLANAAHVFRVRATDGATNLSQVSQFLWTVDNIAPTLAFNQTPLATSSATSAQFAFTSADGGSGLESIQCSLNNATFSNCTSPISLTNLTVGNHNFRVQAIDKASNSNLISYNWSVTTVVVDPLTWNVLPTPELVFNSGGTYDLKPTLPAGTLIAGGKFSVDASGTQLPPGMSLNADTGILSVEAAAVGDTLGVIFSYTSMAGAGVILKSTATKISVVSGIDSSILADDRKIDWSVAGVPGGIINRTIICATISAATYGNGVTDASGAISTAISSCPAGQVVYIPEGTYRVNSRVYSPFLNSITIRGAGMGKTVLIGGSGQIFLFGTSDYPRLAANIAITAGSSKGSQSFTVSSTAGLLAGKLMRIEQDDLGYVMAIGSPSGNTKSLSSIHRIVSIVNNTVNITPALPFAFNLNPKMVQYTAGPIVNFGLENLTIDGNRTAHTGIQVENAWGSWIKNVETRNMVNRQMLFLGFVNGEIRGNYAHSVVGGGPNTEGIDFYEDSSFNLIEDNISYNGGFPGIILGDSRGGCSGNVIAYNFAYNTNVGDRTYGGADISFSHGPHNTMNLAEGNIASGITIDGYYGSSSHNTIFRNWLTATHPTATQNLIAVNIGRWSTYTSIIGNVLGTSTFPVNGLFQPETTFSYSDRVVYKLGFPNMGNNGFDGIWAATNPPNYKNQSATGKGLQELDMNVKSTAIIHGNYDFKNKATRWDSAIAQQVLPNSLYLKTKPSWWPANLIFPAIGPDQIPRVNSIPALERFKQLNPAASVPAF